MFGVNSINGSFQWLGVTTPLRNDGPPWTDNTLDSSPSWVTSGTATNPNWGIQPGGLYGSVAVLWSGPVFAMPAYAFRSLENMRSSARRVRDDLLQ